MANAKGKVVKKLSVDTPDGKMNLTFRMLGKSAAGGAGTISNQADPFQGRYGDGGIIRPPYDPYALMMLKEQSPALARCIKAKVANVVGFGWELARINQGPDEDDPPPQALTEKAPAHMLFTYCNRRQNMTMLSRECKDDWESIGYSFTEIVRNGGGEIAELHRLPAHLTRLTARDTEETEFLQPVLTPDGKYTQVPRRERFRRIVQIVDGKKVFFKEFGDPRDISAKTGEPVKQGSLLANEVLMLSQGCSYSPYGVPLWISEMMAIMGTRQAEGVNYLFFENKSIPPLIITVAGGALVPETMRQLQDVFEREIKGMKNFHNVLLLQAEGTPTGSIEGEGVAPVRVEVKPLTQFIQSDAQFLEYIKHNASSVYASFRIPPIYFGLSSDYNRATSREAARAVEEQVFIPERREFDYIINTTIMADLGIGGWAFRSLGAKTTDHSQIVSAMGPVSDALPVAVIQEAVAEMRGVPAGQIDERFRAITLAELRASLQPDLFGGDADDDEEDENNRADKLIDKLMAVRKKLSDRLRGGEPS